jgi:hypothetical protein
MEQKYELTMAERKPHRQDKTIVRSANKKENLTVGTTLTLAKASKICLRAERETQA